MRGGPPSWLPVGAAWRYTAQRLTTGAPGIFVFHKSFPDQGKGAIVWLQEELVGPDTANGAPFAQINACCCDQKLSKQNMGITYRASGLPPSGITAPPFLKRDVIWGHGRLCSLLYVIPLRYPCRSGLALKMKGRILLRVGWRQLHSQG